MIEVPHEKDMIDCCGLDTMRAAGGSRWIAQSPANFLSAWRRSALYEADLWRGMDWVCKDLIGREPEARHARRLRALWTRAVAGEGAARLCSGDRRGALRSFGCAVGMTPLPPRSWIGLAVASTIRRWPPV